MPATPFPPNWSGYPDLDCFQVQPKQRWGKHGVGFSSRLEKSPHRKNRGRPPAMNNCSHGREIRNQGGCSDTSERLKTKNKSMITLPGLKKGLTNTSVPSLPTPTTYGCVIYESLKLRESHFLICTTEITLPTARLLGPPAHRALETAFPTASPCSLLPNRASILSGTCPSSRWLQKCDHLLVHSD